MSAGWCLVASCGLVLHAFVGYVWWPQIAGSGDNERKRFCRHFCREEKSRKISILSFRERVDLDHDILCKKLAGA